MTEEEALQMVRDARQKMMDDWKGKSQEEVIRELNEAGRRAMEDIERRRQAAAQAGGNS